MNQDGIWLSILEYASAKKVSISTIRRSIKAGHVKYKEENGKYLIWTKKEILEKSIQAKANQGMTGEELALKLELEMLRRTNRELQEEINDLKMLLSVYENKNQFDINELPPLPEIEL